MYWLIVILLDAAARSSQQDHRGRPVRRAAAEGLHRSCARVRSSCHRRQAAPDRGRRRRAVQVRPGQPATGRSYRRKTDDRRRPCRPVEERQMADPRGLESSTTSRIQLLHVRHVVVCQAITAASTAARRSVSLRTLWKEPTRFIAAPTFSASSATSPSRTRSPSSSTWTSPTASSTCCPGAATNASLTPPGHDGDIPGPNLIAGEVLPGPDPGHRRRTRADRRRSTISTSARPNIGAL